jgi:DNA-binding ferritin-like protein (Dps family)
MSVLHRIIRNKNDTKEIKVFIEDIKKINKEFITDLKEII